MSLLPTVSPHHLPSADPQDTVTHAGRKGTEPGPALFPSPWEGHNLELTEAQTPGLGGEGQQNQVPQGQTLGARGSIGERCQ